MLSRYLLPGQAAYRRPRRSNRQLAVGRSGSGKTMAILGLVVLSVALIDALQDIPSGWPAYQ